MVRSLRNKVPLTARGVTLSLTLPIATFIGLRHFDIILSLVGLTLAPLLMLFLGVTIRLLYQLKKRLTLTFQGPAFGETIVAQHAAKYAITAYNCSLLPLYSLKIKLNFDQERVESSKVLVHGLKGDRLIIEPTITFPHRGFWTAQTIQCTVEDVFGLTSLTWKHHLSEPARVEVEPAKLNNTPFYPLISTNFSSGDTLASETKRDGDPLDLKSYHPSDGLKRIVWKVYARTGQLISRYPERSMTPEGKLCVFVAADRHDDTVCTAALAYAEQIESVQSELLARCLGCTHDNVATSRESLKNILIDSVWDANFDEILGDIAQLLSLTSSDKTVRTHLIIFLSRRLLVEESYYRALIKTAEYLEETGITPVFFIVPRKEEAETRFTNHLKTSSGTLERWFFKETVQTKAPHHLKPAQWEGVLLENCSKRNWIVEQRVS
jgi:hypothetical protein